MVNSIIDTPQQCTQHEQELQLSAQQDLSLFIRRQHGGCHNIRVSRLTGRRRGTGGAGSDGAGESPHLGPLS